MVASGAGGAKRPRRPAVAVVPLLIHTTLFAYGAWTHSPTLNEPAHLVAGISNWHLRRFDIYKVNAPLVRMAAASPVLATSPKTDWSRFFEGPAARLEAVLGEDFVRANGNRSLGLFVLARWACIQGLRIKILL